MNYLKIILRTNLIYFFTSDGIFEDGQEEIEFEFNAKHPKTKINYDYEK